MKWFGCCVECMDWLKYWVKTLRWSLTNVVLFPSCLSRHFSRGDKHYHRQYIFKEIKFGAYASVLVSANESGG